MRCQFHWGEGPRIDGGTNLFSAWLAWSRYPVVIPTYDRTLGSLIACLDETLRRFGGARAAPKDPGWKTPAALDETYLPPGTRCCFDRLNPVNFAPGHFGPCSRPTGSWDRWAGFHRPATTQRWNLSTPFSKRTSSTVGPGRLETSCPTRSCTGSTTPSPPSPARPRQAHPCRVRAGVCRPDRSSFLKDTTGGN